MIEVVYALAHEQWIKSIPYAEGITAIEAAERSGLMDDHPEISSRPLVLGLFGDEIEHRHVLRDGDRVEICRPLLLDPREMRRRAVATGRYMGQKGQQPRAAR